MNPYISIKQQNLQLMNQKKERTKNKRNSSNHTKKKKRAETEQSPIGNKINERKNKLAERGEG